MVLQNWKKSLSFHERVPKEQPYFGWLAWKIFWLNYSTFHYFKLFENNGWYWGENVKWYTKDRNLQDIQKWTSRIYRWTPRLYKIKVSKWQKPPAYTMKVPTYTKNIQETTSIYKRTTRIYKENSIKKLEQAGYTKNSNL